MFIYFWFFFYTSMTSASIHGSCTMCVNWRPLIINKTHNFFCRYPCYFGWSINNSYYKW